MAKSVSCIRPQKTSPMNLLATQVVSLLAHCFLPVKSGVRLLYRVTVCPFWIKDRLNHNLLTAVPRFTLAFFLRFPTGLTSYVRDDMAKFYWDLATSTHSAILVLQQLLLGASSTTTSTHLSHKLKHFLHNFYKHFRPRFLHSTHSLT